MAFIEINFNSNKKIMASIQELSLKVDALAGLLDEEQAQVESLLTILNDTIAELRDQVSNLNAIIADGGTAEQRAEIAAKLDALAADLESTVSDEDFPVDPPVEDEDPPVDPPAEG